MSIIQIMLSDTYVYKQREEIHHQRLLNENLEFKAFQFNSCKQA